MNEYRFLIDFPGSSSGFSIYAQTLGQALALLGVEITRALQPDFEPTGVRLQSVTPRESARFLTSRAPNQ